MVEERGRKVTAFNANDESRTNISLVIGRMQAIVQFKNEKINEKMKKI
jgi:hypothetical protein